MPTSHPNVDSHKSRQGTRQRSTRGLPNTEMPQHEIYQSRRDENIIPGISQHRIPMEILNEGLIPTGTVHPTTKIILGFRSLWKKRRVWNPHQVDAKTETPSYQALLLWTYRRHVQKNNSQNVERNVSRTTHKSQPIRHPRPLKLRPGEKIQEQRRAWKLGA